MMTSDQRRHHALLHFISDKTADYSKADQEYIRLQITGMTYQQLLKWASECGLIKSVTSADMTEMLDYIDTKVDGRSVNSVFEIIPYLMIVFDIDKRFALTVLNKWFDQYERKHPIDEKGNIERKSSKERGSSL